MLLIESDESQSQTNTSSSKKSRQTRFMGSKCAFIKKTVSKAAELFLWESFVSLTVLR